MKKILWVKKIFFSLFIFLSFLCIGAGEPEIKEYAFFADSYEEAQKIAAAQSGELISFCQGIGVLRKRDIVNVKSGVGEKSVKLYLDEVFTVENMETQESQKEQWHLNVLETEEVWETATGKGITVAVIDSGIDSTHEDLKEGIVYQGTTIPETEYGNDKRFDEAYKGGEDYFGHGTHVAGIIGARANGIGCTGIAPDCNIISIKALEKKGSTGTGKTSWVATAIRLAVEQGADIINLSLGGSSVKNELLYTVIKEVCAQNIPVICAAGNITSQQIVFYPGAYEETIAVSAVKQSGDYVDFASSYSNYGNWIDISAPGSTIMSTIPNGYGTKSGTSMACPVVAGGLALLLEEKEDLTIGEMCKLLYDSSTDLGDKGKDDKYGHGVINLNKMLQDFKFKYMESFPIVEFEDNSTIRKGTTIHINAPREGVKVVYTLDGSIPTEGSSVYPAEGIVFPEEMDCVAINSRCILEDGSLGRNILTTYKFIECDSVIGASGRLEESFPMYGNYVEKETNYPYKSYELLLKPGEKVKVMLGKDEFKGVLGLYESLELNHLLETGKVQENGDNVLEWKNNGKQEIDVYVVVKVTDLNVNLGEVNYIIQWNVSKDQEKEENKDKGEGNQEENQKENLITSEGTDEVEEVVQKEEEAENINEEISLNKEDKTGTEMKEDKNREAEITKEPLIYEEDWLYTMENEEVSIDDNIIQDYQKNSKSEQKQEADVEEQKNKEDTEFAKTKKYLLAIIGFGVILESLVIIWYIYGKKKDKSR